MSIDRNGKMTMYLKKNFQYNLRGTQFNIPGVKGGRKGNDMILREDQREYERAVKLKERMDRKALSYDMDAVDFGRAIAGGGKPVVGYGRKNINQAKHNKRR